MRWPHLEVGDLRFDPDPRCAGRVVRILAMNERYADVKAFANLSDAEGIGVKGRRSRILLVRLSSWRLAEAPPPEKL